MYLFLPRWLFERRSKEDSFLIVQCDLGHLYGDLIAYARYRVDDEREKASYCWSPDYGSIHVLFIVHLPRRGGDINSGVESSFVGFQGGRWVSAHIDDLRGPNEAAVSLEDAVTVPISSLFYNMGFVSGAQEQPQTNGKEIALTLAKGKKTHYQCSRLYACIQAAVGEVVDCEQSKAWATRCVNILLYLIPEQPKFPLGEYLPMYVTSLIPRPLPPACNQCVGVWG